MTITSCSETPVVFDAAGEDLVGVLTRPDGEGNGLAVVTLYGTGPFPVFGRNRVGVSLSRGLAELGFHVLRFDYRGAGDSGGAPREADVNHPWVDDALGAVRCLQAEGLHEIVLVCVCFGARTGLAISGQIPGLAAMALISPPVGQANHTETLLQRHLSWYLKRATSPRELRALLQGAKAKRRRSLVAARLRRVVRPPASRDGTKQEASELSNQFFDPLRTLIEADLPVMIVYGRKDDFFADFERALNGPLGKILERAGDRTTLTILDEHAANVASVEAQQNMVAMITGWAASIAPERPPAGHDERVVDRAD